MTAALCSFPSGYAATCSRLARVHCGAPAVASRCAVGQEMENITVWRERVVKRPQNNVAGLL